MKKIILILFSIFFVLELATSRTILIKAYLKPTVFLEQTNTTTSAKGAVVMFNRKISLFFSKKEDMTWSCLFYCGKTATPIKESLCPSTTITLTM